MPCRRYSLIPPGIVVAVVILGVAPVGAAGEPAVPATRTGSGSNLSAATRMDCERPLAETPEHQLTSSPYGHILTNINVWSPDGRWIVYDTRSDPDGSVFDGTRIERVNVSTGEVQVLYESGQGAGCGVVTCNPIRNEVVFIHGPENPAPDYAYGPDRRRGVVVDVARPGVAVNLDACSLAPPFTPGALRGGSHVHVFSPDGRWVSFTYEDHVLARRPNPGAGEDVNQRNVGISVPARPVRVPRSHPRNHDGDYFSVLATRTTAHPVPGSDEITKAFEEGWVGTRGYRRNDGAWQVRALAFQGLVLTGEGESIAEAFIVDLPEDVTRPGDGPLEGTPTRRPSPPAGTRQRRLTHTANRKYPGLQGPRHWLRSSPDGSRIAMLMRDESGVVQLWTISPTGGDPLQVTHHPWSIASAFTWSPDGRSIAHLMDNSVFLTDMDTGAGRRLTPRSPDEHAPSPLACVFSPDGRRIAYLRQVGTTGATHNQIFLVSVAQQQ
jgi:hypothetical protein